MCLHEVSAFICGKKKSELKRIKQMEKFKDFDCLQPGLNLSYFLKLVMKTFYPVSQC